MPAPDRWETARCFTPGPGARPVQFLYCRDSLPELAGQAALVISAARFRDGPGALTAKEKGMPLVDIQLIEGVFDKSQKQDMIRKVTDAMVAVEGEAMRGVTWVRIQEIAGGEWAIGGKGLTASDIKAMAGR